LAVHSLNEALWIYCCVFWFKVFASCACEPGSWHDDDPRPIAQQAANTHTNSPPTQTMSLRRSSRASVSQEVSYSEA